MSTQKKELGKFQSDLGLASFLNEKYKNQIVNFFNDENNALKFLSAVRSDVQKNPALLDCTPQSIVNAYMTMAQFEFMPSSVSGESYVLPYENSKKVGANEWIKVKEAQFQLGYQGLVTLAYKAGVTSIFADLVRENDQIEMINGGIKHIVDPKKATKERGEIIGAYVVVNYKGQIIGKYMHIADIYAHGKRFSKSFDVNGKYSPWNIQNDPEGWMPKKTVLKQAMKLLPKNETINKAIALDNQGDSKLHDRLEKAKEESKSLEMNNFLIENENKKIEPKNEEDQTADFEEETINPFEKEN